MPRFAAPIALSAIAALAMPLSAAEQPDPGLDRALSGLAAGIPQKCIKRHRVTGTTSFANTLLFEGGRRFYYRNNVAGVCRGLGRGDVPVITSTHADEYCAGDTVRTREATGGSFSGACVLGEFVPYAEAGK